MEVQWTRGRSIGRGSSAAVFLAVNSSSGEVFAVKSAILSLSEPLQREQKILSSFSSPRIVTCQGFDITIDNKEPTYNLHLEYLPGGTLSDEIRKNGGLHDESMMRYYSRQILEGLAFLHSNGLAHCDIKSRNILIGETGAKIADFGCAKRVGPDEAGRIGGTPAFMAPETARGEEQGCACDIWALGCTVIEMATGRSPWESVSDPVSVLYRIACSGEVPEIPSCLSEDGKDFLVKCLKTNPRERWNASQLLEHPFVGKMNSLMEGIWNSYTSSPTSILDQGVWMSMEESGDHGNWVSSTDFGFPADRIRQLILLSGVPNWEYDGNWITIRKNLTKEQEEEEEEGSDLVLDCCSASAYTRHGCLDFLNLLNSVKNSSGDTFEGRRCVGEVSVLGNCNFERKDEWLFSSTSSFS